MNTVRYIFTADDFGPIEYINEGIIQHVMDGSINSVQVLSNIDEDTLHKALNKLWNAVPKGMVLDIGVHFTLSSGSPLYKGKDDSIASTLKAWGQMIFTKEGKLLFNDYTQFYLRYVKGKSVKSSEYLNLSQSIKEEFALQRKRLEGCVAAVNEKNQGECLSVTSASCHHNLFTIHQDLMDSYVDASKGLALRSPKTLPSGTMKSFYGLVLPLINPYISKDLKHIMKKLYLHFGNNQYYRGSRDLKFRTTSFLDVRYYMSLGSKSKVTVQSKKSRIRNFEKMRAHATYVFRIGNRSSQKTVDVESVFHLGKRTSGNKQTYTQMVKHYPGIAAKYFDNRKLESEALHEIKGLSAYENIFERSLISWKDCIDQIFAKK